MDSWADFQVDAGSPDYLPWDGGGGAGFTPNITVAPMDSTFATDSAGGTQIQNQGGPESGWGGNTDGQGNNLYPPENVPPNTGNIPTSGGVTGAGGSNGSESNSSWNWNLLPASLAALGQVISSAKGNSFASQNSSIGFGQLGQGSPVVVAAPTAGGSIGGAGVNLGAFLPLIILVVVVVVLMGVLK